MDSLTTPSPTDRVAADETTIFILGNGPSLKGVDLKRLSDYPTIGMNAAYRYWRKIDWRPTYYACLDEEVGVSHKDEIAALITEGRIEKLLLRANLIDALGPLAKNPRVINFDALRTHDVLLAPPAITTGSHAALWAGVMGFKRIVIAGVDGRYVEMVPGAKRRGGMALEIVREAENPNYFFDDYQRPGDRYNIPNPRPNVHLGAWHDAALNLQDAGIEVYNANPRSAVGYFPFIDLAAFLAGGSPVTPPTSQIERLPFPAEALQQIQLESGKDRFRLFLKSQAARLAAGAVPLALAWLLATMPLGVFSAGSAAAALGLGMLFLVFALLLYTRFVVSREFDALRLQLETARARIRDLERLT